MCKWQKPVGGLAGTTKSKNSTKKRKGINSQRNIKSSFNKKKIIRMKKTAIIATLILSMAVVFIGCKDKRNPGSVYMPDMAYSRAYETYSAKEGLEKKGIHYNGMPVAGTMAIGDMLPYALKNTPEDYIKAASVKSKPHTQWKSLAMASPDKAKPNR